MIDAYKDRPAGSRASGWVAAVFCSFLGGCAATGPQVTELERSQALGVLPAQAIWTRQPTATVALGRQLGSEAEQIVALENDTVIPGDNLLLMRAHLEGGPRLQAPHLDDFLRRNGTLGAPFAAPVESQLRQASDAAGPYVWAEMQATGDTLCVLAMRRIWRERALLPDDMRALDVTLRNCVQGDRAEALAPIGVDRIAMANVSPGPLRSRTMAHLAGPIGRPTAAAAP